MITGHNSEIRHENLVFHVQTEDKGVSNPSIVSLIYLGGQVLAAKQTSYEDLLAQGFDEKDIAERMERQHRTMIAAIRHGRFDDLVRERLAADAGNGGGESVERAAASVGEERLEGLTRSLEEMVSEYLGTEILETLDLELESAGAPEPGQRYDLTLKASASPAGRPLAGVEVEVELISTVRGPEVLATGVTDEDGLLPLTLLLPAISGGMAALVVSAACELGEAEHKILL